MEMSVVNRKREREFESREGLCDSPRPAKCSRSEWTSAEGILSKLLSEDDENSVDGMALREELVSDVMRSLEEEIEGPSSKPIPDIEYLSVASDDELGLPPSPAVVVDQKPGGDDRLFDQSFATDHTVWGDWADEQEFLQILRAADCLYGFDDNEFPSSLAYSDVVFDPYILC